MKKILALVFPFVLTLSAARSSLITHRSSLIALVFPFLLTLSTAHSQNCQAFIWPSGWADGATTLSSIDSASSAATGYLWSTGATTQSITVSDSGAYCVTVTFEGGCTATDCYDLPDECWVTGWWYWLDAATAYVTAWSGPTYLNGTYEWSNGATTQGITVTSGGQYCVTVTKENGCTSTTCIDVPAITGCAVDIQYWYWPDSTVQLHAATGSSGAVYLWSTGATTSEITPAGSGNYCVTITTPNGCTASDCELVNSASCFVNIFPQWDQDSSVVSLVAWGGADSLVYLWNTGATTATIPFTGPGNYCVTITNANGCTADGCYEAVFYNALTIHVLIPDSLNGIYAEVFLIQYDTAQGGVLTAVDTLLTDLGGFAYVGNLPAGQYLVKAALLPGFPYYEDYLPTYFEQSLFWDEATPVDILPAFPWNYGMLVNIPMIAGQNPGGPGFIGGLVSEGANFTTSGDAARGEGDPMAGVQIILQTSDDVPVSATRTASDGAFGFEGLAWGTYRVSVDIPGIAPLHQLVTIGPDQPSAGSVGFTVNGLGSTAAVDPQASPELLAMPNPVRDILTVVLPAGRGQLTLANAQGQVVRQQTERSALARFDVHSLPDGIYFLTLRTDNQSVTTRIIKQ